MNKIIELLRNFKTKYNFLAVIILIIMILAIAGVAIAVPITIGGFIPTIGAILLDLCALPMFIELIKLLTE